jgi:hypothetical protein
VPTVVPFNRRDVGKAQGRPNERGPVLETMYQSWLAMIDHDPFAKLTSLGTVTIVKGTEISSTLCTSIPITCADLDVNNYV